jgi:hypothetical protein
MPSQSDNGFPPPSQITLENTKDAVAAQEELRSSQMMEGKIASLLKVADLSPAMQEEIRRQQPIAADEQKFARQEIDRLKRDKGFVRKLLDGDRQASSDWTRLHQIITLPTAKTPTTYPVR